MTFDGPTPLS